MKGDTQENSKEAAICLSEYDNRGNLDTITLKLHIMTLPHYHLFPLCSRFMLSTGTQRGKF